MAYQQLIHNVLMMFLPLVCDIMDEYITGYYDRYRVANSIQ